MDSDRDRMVNHILAIEQHFYHFLQIGGLPHWADLELTMPQLKVLFLAGVPKPMTASQVARTLGMTLSTLTGVVDRLVNQELVARLEDPSDRRVVLLRATEDGKLLMDQLLQASRDRLRSILEGLSLDELRVVEQALNYLHRSSVALGAEPFNEMAPQPAYHQAKPSTR